MADEPTDGTPQGGLDAPNVFQLKPVRVGVAKAEPNKEAARSNAYESEDEFRNMYITSIGEQGIIPPPYNLRKLDQLAGEENNTLGPCVEAMVTNIDGTGYDFELKGEANEDDEDDAKIDELRDFFGEPWEGVSFLTIRKMLRRDMERTGNAYLEIIRNAKDEIMFFKYVDAKMIRLVTLDQEVAVDVVVKRRGKEVKVPMMKRERRYVQLVNGVSKVYFREFGASRDLDKTNGKFAAKGERLGFQKRGSELIHFKALPDSDSPYGLPRWINQLPSVLGSRKAEEFNLEFFDAGGIPPVLILLQGGTLNPETKGALDVKMSSGSAASRNRAQVLEIMPSGGTFNSPNQARVTVERFGAERQEDSMFGDYDARCATNIQVAYRIPPIFLGKAQDYAFASAVASYAVGEAQVFKPERDEFDEIFTLRFLPAMGYPEYKLVSKPLVIQDPANKLSGIDKALSIGDVDKEALIYELNEATGLDIKYKKAEVPPGAMMGHDGKFVLPSLKPAGEEGDDPKKGDIPNKEKMADKAVANGKGAVGAKLTVVKSEALALRAMTSLRKRDIEALDRYVELAKAADDTEFMENMAEARFAEDTAIDTAGLADLTRATVTAMSLKKTAGCGHDHS